ncbi:MAG: zinc ribbon domain-containing protein [Candidatus Riflebacteria bacterium]|nr:zinc ribbon domain-containing protein [Candidatus Riflebacteria bacterium]
MPLYTYRARVPETACETCRELIEVFQKFSEAPIAMCPQCGNPIVRIMHSTPTLRDSSNKTILSDDNLKKHGFKKLVNRGGGKFDEVV